ncbi:FliM/FliN family flagellar motor switch protein [Sphingomonas gilva]|uniref:FliM/FliN family flagellar motor switch protein n=1 Tax=Sphingomonas gilva TaxID=2305907 RepID=UPI0015F9F11A|nr:FliM/FliN family flagellar motor switch protein [Sphingomonas gilva]
MNDLIDAAAQPPADPKKPNGIAVSRRLIAHVDVQLEAFLGDARMTVAELAALKAESIVRLDAPINGLVELRLNGSIVAHGELVAVDENFGIRITGVAQWPD